MENHMRSPKFSRQKETQKDCQLFSYRSRKKGNQKPEERKQETATENKSN